LTDSRHSGLRQNDSRVYFNQFFIALKLSAIYAILMYNRTICHSHTHTRVRAQNKE